MKQKSTNDCQWAISAGDITSESLHVTISQAEMIRQVYLPIKPNKAQWTMVPCMESKRAWEKSLYCSLFDNVWHLLYLMFKWFYAYCIVLYILVIFYNNILNTIWNLVCWARWQQTNWQFGIKMSWSLGRTMCGMLTWYFFLRFFSLRQTPSNSAAPNIDSKESEEEEVFSCVMLYHRNSFAGFSWYPMPTSMVRTAHVCWSYACSSQGKHSWFREWENKSWKTQSLKSQRKVGNIYDIFRTFHHQCCFKVRTKTESE